MIRFASVSRSVAYFIAFKNLISIVFLTEYSVRKRHFSFSLSERVGRERKSDLKFSKSWPRGCQEAVIIRLHTTRTEIDRKITECKRNLPHLVVSMYDCSIIVYRLILLFPYTLSFCQ